VSSVFICAAEVEVTSILCFERPFIPDLRNESPAKLFRFFDWKSQVSMKVLTNSNYLCPRDVSKPSKILGGLKCGIAEQLFITFE
jgi:hypothetical protein